MIERRRHVRWALGCLVVTGAILAAPAFAADAPPKQDAWQFDATPYLWFAGLDGDVKIGNLPTGGVEASFSDIASSLHFAAMGAFEGRKNRWGFLVDAMYIDLSDSTSTPKGLLFGDVDVSVRQQLYTGLASYRVLDGNVAVDVFAGPRYVSIATDLNLTSGAAAGRAKSASVSWWDGLGGARVVWRVHKNWLLTGFADVGGGGTKLTWEALAGAGYEFNKLVSVKFGYRYLSIDYDTTELVYDMAMAGPYAGVGFRF
jgi:opacity protein-like surface antigen